ncbi:MAG: ferrous iron transport protein A [Clostridia bacterium]|nr:ferrous iron transport protein A [Clostridia bacterium]
MIRLSELEKNEECRIVRIFAEDKVRLRLHSLGFIEGERIKRVRVSVLGDPVMYEIDGTYVALRCEEAFLIGIERI